MPLAALAKELCVVANLKPSVKILGLLLCIVHASFVSAADTVPPAPTKPAVAAPTPTSHAATPAVGSAGSTAPASNANSAAPHAAASASPVNLNTADAATLGTLTGIGPAKANAILEYRKLHGPFKSVDDLLEVKGIGAATLDKNRARLKVE